MKLSMFTISVLAAVMMAPLRSAAAEAPLTLDSCRSMAAVANRELKACRMEAEAAGLNRKSAHTNYLPKVSVSALYMHTGREISLLSDDQKTTLSNLGNALGMPALNPVGQSIVDALHTDTRNAVGAAVVLTQPVYMGGRIRAYNNITRYAGDIAGRKCDQRYQDLMVDVESTYWNIVELCAKRKLAESYRSLVVHLDSDVQQLIAAGFATKADGLSVRVKVNDADVALITIDNGLEILRMHLNELCERPLDSAFTLADENPDSISAPVMDEIADYDAWQTRPELSALSSLIDIHEEKVKIARAEFLPTVALTGGYAAAYPALFNGFEKKFKGTWNIGVAVNIPVLTWGDRRYKTDAAKAESAAARLNYEDTREKIELQVAQCRRRVLEARERRKACIGSQEAAEENLRYASEGMREGVIPVSNVLEAQTAWLSAKTGLLSADIDLRLACLALRRSLGIVE